MKYGYKIAGLAMATVVAIATSSVAFAATVGGSVKVNIYQTTGTGTGGSADATPANLTNLLGSTIYTGKLDFGTFTQNDNPADTTTIGQWLDSGVSNSGGGAGYTALAAGISSLQLSKPSISNNTATTTWFEFLGLSSTGFDMIVRHDDGISFYDDGVNRASSSAPTTVINTAVNGYDGGEFRLIYAATNGDPSVLKVEGDGTLVPVPLPAAGFLLFGALGGLAAQRRRRKAA